MNEPLLATDDNMPLILLALGAAEDIAADTETSGLNVRNPGCDYFMGFCFDVPGLSCYIPFRHKADNVELHWLGTIEKILQDKDLIWHNRKFDMHSMKTIGIDPLVFKGLQYDTLMLAQLVNEELYSKELDYLGKKYFGEGKANKDHVKKWGSLFGYDVIPPAMYREYGAQDATLTRRLRDVLYPQLLRQELGDVYWNTEAPFTRLLYLMEQRGVGVNTDFCSTMSSTGSLRMATIRRELGINPASPLDLGSYLLTELNLPVFAHTGSCAQCAKGYPVGSHEGKASFNKVAMAEYDEILSLSDNLAAKRITEYRGWQKAVTSLYDPLLTKVGPDGKIRTDFKQHGTVTGRLSASNPNLQQVPRGSDKPWNGNAKSSFTSGREGYSLYGWDYSQLELRLAAAYGQEEILLTEFESDSADPFNVLTPLIFGKYSPELRHQTKNCFVYPSLYGAGLSKVALVLGRSTEETRPLYDRYKQSIAGITAVSKQVNDLVEQRKYVKYWDGRRRHIRSRGDAHKAWNSVLQGGGAQLVKAAMLRCLEFEDDNCYMVLQVHDEITFCIRTDLIPHYEPMIVKAMTDWPDFGVRFAVQGKEWK